MSLGTSKAEDNLDALKARRDMDRLTLMDRVAEARDMATPAALAQRAKAEVQDKARGAAMQALEIANDHRGVVVGTVSVLALWAVRNHVGQKLAAKMGPAAAQVGLGIGRLLANTGPALIAPFAPAWVAPFIGPIARHFLAPAPEKPASKPPVDPAD